MRELATSVMSYLFAQTLYTGQEIAKAVGVPQKHVTAKNPPAPGSEGESREPSRDNSTRTRSDGREVRRSRCRDVHRRR
jgi:hypothetical protein